MKIKYKLAFTTGKYFHTIISADYLIGFIKDSFYHGDTIWGFVFGRFFIGIARKYER